MRYGGGEAVSVAVAVRWCTVVPSGAGGALFAVVARNGLKQIDAATNAKAEKAKQRPPKKTKNQTRKWAKRISASYTLQPRYF